MQVYKEKQDLQEAVKQLKKDAKKVGLVPTMGALHEGHLSLLREANKHCDQVIVSIFVNPTQFNNSSDLDNYPRTLSEDFRLLEQEFANLIVFAPSEKEIYGAQTLTENFDFGKLARQMEGKYRNGHFDGVGTVLKRLFTIVNPDKAFFGEKDYQQLMIVKKLVQLTQQDIEIVGCPISREQNGLARSSRNKRLTKEEQEKASFIYDVLKKTKIDFGTKNAFLLKEEIEQQFLNNSFLKLEYFEISDADTLEPINKESSRDKKYRAFIAAYANDVRLIDNIALN